MNDYTEAVDLISAVVMIVAGGLSVCIGLSVWTFAPDDDIDKTTDAAHAVWRWFWRDRK